MSDRNKVAQFGRVGRKVAFVGGPDAGKVRRIPENIGQVTAGDWIYHIHPVKFQGVETMWFAYNVDVHPAQLIVDMWEVYSTQKHLEASIDGS